MRAITRTITTQDLDEFSAVLGKIADRTGELAPAGVNAAGATLRGAASDPDGAAAFGMVALAGMGHQHTVMMSRFEREALRCLGEQRNPGESPGEFYSRIAGLDAEQLVAMMARNGVYLLRA